jgi:hypothetical protein
LFIFFDKLFNDGTSARHELLKLKRLVLSGFSLLPNLVTASLLLTDHLVVGRLLSLVLGT